MGVCTSIVEFYRMDMPVDLVIVSVVFIHEFDVAVGVFALLRLKFSFFIKTGMVVLTSGTIL